MASVSLPSAAEDLAFERPVDRFSVGLMLGGPTGVIVQRDLRNGDAFDLGVGAIYSPGLRLHIDYLWTVVEAHAARDLTLRFEVGLGVMAGILTQPCNLYSDFGSCSGNHYTGARLPIALELWPRAPVVFGVQIAPAIAFNHDGASGLLDLFLFARLVL